MRLFTIHTESGTVHSIRHTKPNKANPLRCEMDDSDVHLPVPDLLRLVDQPEDGNVITKFRCPNLKAWVIFMTPRSDSTLLAWSINDLEEDGDVARTNALLKRFKGIKVGSYLKALDLEKMLLVDRAIKSMLKDKYTSHEMSVPRRLAVQAARNGLAGDSGRLVGIEEDYSITLEGDRYLRDKVEVCYRVDGVARFSIPVDWRTTYHMSEFDRNSLGVIHDMVISHRRNHLELEDAMKFIATHQPVNPITILAVKDASVELPAIVLGNNVIVVFGDLFESITDIVNKMPAHFTRVYVEGQYCCSRLTSRSDIDAIAIPARPDYRLRESHSEYIKQARLQLSPIHGPKL